jgi:hypothetical protein
MRLDEALVQANRREGASAQALRAAHPRGSRLAVDER